MTVQHAFRVTDPEALTLWHQAHDDRDRWLTEVLAAAAALHPQAKPYGASRRSTGLPTIQGIVGPDVPWQERRGTAGGGRTPNYRLDPVPDGWRWTESRDCYRPRQGKVGAPARDWLAALPKAKPDARTTVVAHLGMPAEVFLGSHVYWPGVWLYGDTLWIGYGARLDAKDEDGWNGGRSWMPDPMPPGVVEARLSEFYAAREAHEEARNETEEAAQ